MKYAPKGFEPCLSTEYLYFEKDEDGDAVIKLKDNIYHGGYNSKTIDIGYLLKAACQLYIGDKRADLTREESFIAHFAGYTVSDNFDDTWAPSENYDDCDFSCGCSPLTITSTNGEVESETITIPRQKLEELEAEIAKLKAAADKGEF